ncbi:MAG: hypothetical protein Q9179_006154 [Wetmoreana sp. 5 TL-2023]
MKVYADGGANRVKDMNLTEGEEKITLPELICGDCDSIRGNVQDYYVSRGAQLTKDPDQYSTDVTKSLKCIVAYTDLEKMDPLHVVLFGGMGGRFDQAFSLIHQLYTASHSEALLKGRIYLVNPQSICFLLAKGKNTIKTPLGPGGFAPNVGIIPIGRPSIISTRGLEWNVTDWYTEFGGQISTSNHIKSPTIEVETSERVLFTIELDPSSLVNASHGSPNIERESDNND